MCAPEQESRNCTVQRACNRLIRQNSDVLRSVRWLTIAVPLRVARQPVGD